MVRVGALLVAVCAAEVMAISRVKRTPQGAPSAVSGVSTVASNTTSGAGAGAASPAAQRGDMAATPGAARRQGQLVVDPARESASSEESNKKPKKIRKKKKYRSTSSSSGENNKEGASTSNNKESLGMSDASSSSSSGSKKRKRNKFKPKSTIERHGWKKWHRKCQSCPEEKMKWKDPRVKWICGQYQRARRSFKSACLMHKRNCQDGTMFVKMKDGRCSNSSAKDSRPHGEHWFYDYNVKLSDDSSSGSSSSSSSSSDSSSGT